MRVKPKFQKDFAKSAAFALMILSVMTMLLALTLLEAFKQLYFLQIYPPWAKRGGRAQLRWGLNNVESFVFTEFVAVGYVLFMGSLAVIAVLRLHKQCFTQRSFRLTALIGSLVWAILLFIAPAVLFGQMVDNSWEYKEEESDVKLYLVDFRFSFEEEPPYPGKFPAVLAVSGASGFFTFVLCAALSALLWLDWTNKRPIPGYNKGFAADALGRQ